MSKEPSVGLVLVGLFVILFGLCFTLVGGGCTLFLLASLGQSGTGDLGIFLLISLVCLAIGVLILWAGIKVVKAGYARDDGPPGPDVGGTPQ